LRKTLYFSGLKPQYSVGSSTVVTALSASVMIQMRPAAVW